MRIMRIEHGDGVRYARALDERSVELLSDAPWLDGKPTGERVALSAAQLRVPVAPTKIVCVGRNYAAHAKELGGEVPSEPLLFLKPPSSLLPPLGSIVLPRASERVEHEAEIGIVIGRRVRGVSAAEAQQAIFGVTCINDVTARDLQRKDVQFTRAKSFDTFCPIGPWIETEFELDALTVSGRVNGQLRQHGAATEMAFSILTLIAFISEIMTLEPGDVIATGTPEGVGPLVPGDQVEVEIAGVGVLRNTVVAA